MHQQIIDLVNSKIHYFKTYLKSIEYYFQVEPSLNADPKVIHSFRTRIKSDKSLKDKLKRKSQESDPITLENVFDKITDLVGIRIIHLYQQQFTSIHNVIMDQVKIGEWVLFEPPKAYTWDPEAKAYFDSLGLTTHIKESFYTSIHYVIKPRTDSIVKCEIQVRTLFEEIWGEIDHSINYPTPVDSLSCKEQLLVLARLVGAGSRLADSIFRVHKELAKKDDVKGE